MLNAIVVCGPSGVGKGTLLKRLLHEYTDRFAYSVSHTTRAPRVGEVDGREYFFVTREAIRDMYDRNEFLEMCDVHGNLYGTSIAAVRAVQAQGKTCVLEIDVKGAQLLRSRRDTGLDMVYLFITAPIDEVRNRILKRGADDEATLQRRLATARSEYAFLQQNSTFFDAVIVNDVLEEAYVRLVDAINEELRKRHMTPLPAPAVATALPATSLALSMASVAQLHHDDEHTHVVNEQHDMAACQVQHGR